MRGNRKHQTAAVRFGPALKALALCVFLGGSGVGYVWQKEQINILAERQRQVDARYEQQRNKNERLARILATLQSHGEIEAQIKRNGLGLVPPQPDQIVHIVESPVPAEPAVRASEALYAAGPALTGAGRGR
jgi:hypothetical protein